MADSQRRVLLLAADQFEDMELLYPLYRLAEEDIAVTVAGLDTSPLTGKKGYGPLAIDTTDGNLISARTPADLGPWMKARCALRADAFPPQLPPWQQPSVSKGVR